MIFLLDLTIESRDASFHLRRGPCETVKCEVFEFKKKFSDIKITKHY